MKKILFIFAIMFLFSFVSATTQSYHIFDKSVLVELEFEEVSNLQLEMPKDARTLEVNVNYSLVEGVLEINSGKDVVVRYVSDYFIEKTKKGYFFVIENKIENSEVFVYLPEGAKLFDGALVFPKDYVLSSDGYRIILEWENFNEENVLVSYEFFKEGSFVFYLISGSIILGLAYFYFIERRKYLKHKKKIKKLQKAEKEKTKEIEKKVFTANLFGDEKKIVEFLIPKGKEGCWTKEISRGLEINKVTLSRKLRNLEQRGLINKVPYGNADKIFLKR
jgi:uncharacterized membrane protein